MIIDPCCAPWLKARSSRTSPIRDITVGVGKGTCIIRLLGLSEG